MSYLSTLILAAGAFVLLQPPEPPAPQPAPRTGQLEVAPPPRPVAPPLTLPRRHALVLCGHPGDAAHAKTFAETVNKLGEGLTKTADIPVERQYVVFGAEQPKGIAGATGPATKEAVAAAVADVKKKLKPEDGLWVIVLGHGHHDGRQAFWCLPGPDLSAAEFGKLFADVNCREQVFVMTGSLSGYFVGPLAKRDRVVIAATEADAETNETTFPTVFARLLSAGLESADHDFDSDNRLTLFDLYVATAKEIAQNYTTAEQVATEHAQLDDDGDGVGHEVQAPFLPVEQGGTPPGQKAKRPHRDGARAAQVPLARRD